MIKHKLIILFSGIIFFLSGPALEAQPDPGSKPEEDHTDTFTRIADSSSRVMSIKSEFIQEKHLKMMEKVIISKGLFFFQKPDRLRWELVEPSSFGFAVNGDKARRWRGKKGRSQVFKISREPVLKVIIDQVFAWANADFKRLEKGYDITVTSKDPIILKLVPRSTQEKKFLDHLILSFAGDSSYVDSVEVHEIGNDFTRIRFQNTVINQTLMQDLF